MEIQKKNLYLLQRKGQAENQLTFDEDFNVPDHCPDVRTMIQSKGEIQIEEMQAAEEKVLIRGALHFRLLYMADAPGSMICSLEGSLPIAESLHLDGIVSGDKIQLKWEIEDLTLHVINSRKLNVKAIAGFFAYVDALHRVQLPTAVKEREDLSVQSKTVQLLTLGVHKKDTIRRKEEILLASNKPNIQEVLWKEIAVRGLELRAEEGKVKARGELAVFLLYRGDDETDSVQWLEQIIPLEGEAACEGCTMDMIPYIDTSMIQTSLEVKPDADGEERIFLVDVVLELDMKLYQEETASLLLDVYTPQKECLAVRQTDQLERLLVKNASKCRVSDRVSLQGVPGKILQICHSDGKIRTDEVAVVENGLQIRGVLQVQMLYSVGDDEMPFYSRTAVLPFSHLLEVQGMDPACRYQLQTELEQLSAVMLDGSEVEVKAVMNLNALVVRQWEEPLVTEIQEQEPDLEKLESMPGIVWYLVQPEDTLWDIARTFHTTMEVIREVNHLGEEELKPMQPLLIIKQNPTGSSI